LIAPPGLSRISGWRLGANPSGAAVVALFLVTLGLVTAKSALRVAYLTAIITFLSGIAGVAQHYFLFGGAFPGL